MGIRVNKVLGYGITDLATENGRIVDERFNLNSVYFDEANDKADAEEYEDSLTVEAYMSFLHSKSVNNVMPSFSMDRVMLKEGIKRNQSYSVRDSFVFDCEGGSPEVFCLVPVHLQNKWRRVDDPIDYFELLSQGLTGAEPNVTMLDDRSGVYPYQGSVDKRTGDVLPLQKVQNWVRAKNVSGGNEMLQFFTTDLGFSSVEEADENIVMQPSPDIVDLLEFSGLLSDLKYVYDFKPMIYTYWS